MEHAEHHDHDHSDVPSDVALRVKALESLLVEKGLVDPAALDAIVETYEHKVGPHNGARVVARAWTDPAYKQRLLQDGTTALAELGYAGPQGSIIVVENTDTVHNVIVCTLCSCYPYPVLGLPPVWYKSAAYRSRAVIDPRGVLSELGLNVSPDVEIRVWDSNAEVRYMVLPQRPAGSEQKMTEAEPSKAGYPRRNDWCRPCPAAGDAAMNSVHDMGGMHGLGPILYAADEPVFHAAWEGRVAALFSALGALGRWNTDAVRYRMERMPPNEYLRASYYERWLRALTELAVEADLISQAELDSGRPDPGTERQTVCANGGTGQSQPGERTANGPNPNQLLRASIQAMRCRASNIHPVGHTRLPRYVRGRTWHDRARSRGAFERFRPTVVWAARRPRSISTWSDSVRPRIMGRCGRPTRQRPYRALR